MKKNPTSDPIYKRVYAFAEMVADLLRSVVPKATLEALDLRTLEKVPAEYVGEHFQQRHGDTVWRVRAGGPDSAWAYVLVLLEFQASSDATMAQALSGPPARTRHTVSPWRCWKCSPT